MLFASHHFRDLEMQLEIKSSVLYFILSRDNHFSVLDCQSVALYVLRHKETHKAYKTCFFFQNKTSVRY